MSLVGVVRQPLLTPLDDTINQLDAFVVMSGRNNPAPKCHVKHILEINALERIKKDTYGISVVSGLPIPKERLEAIPHADKRVEEKATGMSWR